MRVIITPNKLKGDVVIPPSKSLSHRAIIAAGLARGESKISNIIYSKDILATISAMRSLGVEIKEFDDYLIIKGNKLKRVNDVIDANESGSTIRFIIPIALTVDEKITFVGHNNLVNRPLDTFFEIFDNQNIKYEKEDKYLPLTVYSGIKPGEFNIRGDVSSQFITGLLYALPLLNGDSIINITTDLESKGYIDLTLDVLKMFGVNVINENYKKFIVKGNQEYIAHDYVVEGDYSQSAFFLVADMLGADIKIKGLNRNSKQGDKKILDDITSFGGNIFYDGECDVYARTNKPCGTQIDFSQSPDLGPALSVLAALSKGRTEFVNAERLRLKECDRISSVVEELEKLGAKVIETEDGMIFEGVERFKGAVLDSHNDHRLAMAFAMASLKCDGEITILNAECVTKSYPDFFKVFESLGGIVRYED